MDQTSQHILVVEDEPVSLLMLTDNLQEAGYSVVSAMTGEAAWNLLLADPMGFDAILLDRVMPDMDGIEVLRRVKSDARLLDTPVIMQTSLSDPADVALGLKAGAYYYVTKPFGAEALLAIVSAAVADRNNHRALKEEASRAGRALLNLHRAAFEFRTPIEARDIATLMANAAPDPGRVVLGLSELMLNAVEHGNLAISFAEKAELLRRGNLKTEIERRLQSAEYAGRRASLSFERTPDGVSFLIRDEGAGFDWNPYLEMSPDRASAPNGRGIAISRMLSFDAIEYQGCGNQVQAVVKL